MNRGKQLAKAHRRVEEFNRKYPVGSVVLIRPPFRRSLIYTFVITKPAAVNTGGEPVVRIYHPGRPTFAMVPVKHIRKLISGPVNRAGAAA